MFYKSRRKSISAISENDDKKQRFDYEKFNVEFSSAIIGNEENIKDSR